MSSNQTDNEHAQKNEFAMKIAVLKKAYLEEKKRNQDWSSENENWKEKLAEKDSFLSKLQHDYTSLNNNLSRSDPKKYYESLLNQPIHEKDADEEIARLNAENARLKEEIVNYQEQNTILKEQLEETATEIENNKSNESSAMTKLQEELMEKDKTIQDNNKRISVMTDMCREFDAIKVNYDQQIAEYKLWSSKNNKEITSLNEQINTWIVAITHLKSEIEDMSSVNYSWKKSIEETREITRKYTFVGKWCVKDEIWNRKTVEVFFGSYDEAIEVTIGANKMILLISDVNFIKKFGRNKLIFNYSDSGVHVASGGKYSCENSGGKWRKGDDEVKKVEIVCEFTARECEYIYKFYTEMRDKYVKESNILFFNYEAYLI